MALAVASADKATLQAGEADVFERAAKRLLDAAASANAHSADEAAAAVAIAGARCRTAFAAAQDSERETLGLSSTMAAGSQLELTLSCAEELLAGIALRRLKHVRQSDRPSPSILPVPAFPTTIFSHCFCPPTPPPCSCFILQTWGPLLRPTWAKPCPSCIASALPFWMLPRASYYPALSGAAADPALRQREPWDSTEQQVPRQGHLDKGLRTRLQSWRLSPVRGHCSPQWLSLRVSLRWLPRSRQGRQQLQG